MVYIRTYAYNAEKTLARAIESILNQTYTEFKYYILDNGSKDGTREIIKEYAKKDSRIVPFYADVNLDKTINLEFWLHTHNLDDNDYFCFLDADDEYYPEFIEETKKFMDENQLDIVAVGSEMVDAFTGQIVSTKNLKKDCIVNNGEEFGQMFSVLHWNLRQVWGKLYRGKTVKVRYETWFPERWPGAYGADTANVFECVKAAERIGICAKVLHTYTVSMGSNSYRYVPKRIESDGILHEMALELLIQKCGTVSDENMTFLYAVYFNAIRDTVKVVVNAELKLEEQLSLLAKIVSNKYTCEMFQCQTMELYGISYDEKKEFLKNIIHWVLAKTVTQKEYSSVVWRLFRLINGEFATLIREEQFVYMEYHFSRVITMLLLSEYEEALDYLKDELRKEEQITEESVGLAQNLAAIIERQEDYIYFSKRMIELWLENGKIQQAKEELDAWLELLPNDAELRELQIRME